MIGQRAVGDVVVDQEKPPGVAAVAVEADEVGVLDGGEDQYLVAEGVRRGGRMSAMKPLDGDTEAIFKLREVDGPKSAIPDLVLGIKPPGGRAKLVVGEDGWLQVELVASEVGRHRVLAVVAAVAAGTEASAKDDSRRQGEYGEAGESEKCRGEEDDAIQSVIVAAYRDSGKGNIRGKTEEGMGGIGKVEAAGAILPPAVGAIGVDVLREAPFDPDARPQKVHHGSVQLGLAPLAFVPGVVGKVIVGSIAALQQEKQRGQEAGPPYDGSPTTNDVATVWRQTEALQPAGMNGGEAGTGLVGKLEGGTG